jgi:hypothetical protein
MNTTNVTTLYRIFTSAENRVAGGEGVVGVYGSLAGSSMQRIFSTMKTRCDFDVSSTFLDIGAGLGRPLLHAIYLEGVTQVQGIEIDHVKCMKAEAFADRVGMILHERNLTRTPSIIPEIVCESIEDVGTIEPATHVYSFWEGIPAHVQEKIVFLCNESTTLRSIAVVQRRVCNPHTLIGDGFALVDSFPVTMSGSRRQFVAYMYCR